MSPAPGWFPDPGGQPHTHRYWDGTRWTDQLRPAVPPAAEPSPPVATSPHQGHTQPGGPMAAPWDEQPQVQPQVQPHQQRWDQRGHRHNSPHGTDAQVPEHYSGHLSGDPYRVEAPGDDPYGPARRGRGAPSAYDEPEPSAPRRASALSKMSAARISEALPGRFDLRTLAFLAGAIVVLIAVYVLRGSNEASIPDKIAEQLAVQGTTAEVSCPAEVPDQIGASMKCTATLEDGSTQQVIVTIKDDQNRYSWQIAPSTSPAPPSSTPPAAPGG